MKGLLQSVGNLADRILCVVAAIILLQAPIYMNQYQNVLSGAQMESEISYERLRQIAADFEQTLTEYLDELLANDNPKVVANAEADQEQVERYESYSDALESLQSASVMTRPFVFASHYDPAIASAVIFEPGLPMTMEGFVYALVGIVGMMLLIALIKRIFGLNKRTKEIA